MHWEHAAPWLWLVVFVLILVQQSVGVVAVVVGGGERDSMCFPWQQVRLLCLAYHVDNICSPDYHRGVHAAVPASGKFKVAYCHTGLASDLHRTCCLHSVAAVGCQAVAGNQHVTQVVVH